MACMEGYIITLITFLHFPFSNVSSRCLHNWTKNCINYNSFDFLRYGFSMVSPWHFYQSTKSHTNCICLAFLQCSMTPVTPETLKLPRLLKLWDCMESREMGIPALSGMLYSTSLNHMFFKNIANVGSFHFHFHFRIWRIWKIWTSGLLPLGVCYRPW